MKQSDYQRLAKQFVESAVKVQEGESLLIHHRGPEALPMAHNMKLHAEGLGAKVRLEDCGSDVVNRMLTNPSEADIEAFRQRELAMMQGIDCYIGVGDDAEMQKYNEPTIYRNAINDGLMHRVNNTRWVITRAPTAAFAQACGTNLPEFEEFYLKACLLDYDRMAQAVIPLTELMDRTEHVRMFSPNQNTDLAQSIAGILSKGCTGEMNIPDGENYSAPVVGSVEGHIHYGPSAYNGFQFDFIDAVYEHGSLVHAVSGTAEQTRILNEILDTDAGARTPGEFAVGFHPHIVEPMGNILFDEKIGGSIHIASGQAYKGKTYNGNDSKVHWDMVHSQRPEHGGGDLIFDDRLIRRDGRFVVPELFGLNPENLM